MNDINMLNQLSDYLNIHMVYLRVYTYFSFLFFWFKLLKYVKNLSSSYCSNGYIFWGATLLCNSSRYCHRSHTCWWMSVSEPFVYTHTIDYVHSIILWQECVITLSICWMLKYSNSVHHQNCVSKRICIQLHTSSFFRNSIFDNFDDRYWTNTLEIS